MATPELELVSFKLCPYVQRAKITLARKGIPHRTTYIDLADPPEWFAKRSPLGLVPILVVDGKHIIFESAVINEYLDEATGGGLLPEDPLERAKARAWIAYASACLESWREAAWARDKAGFEAGRDALVARLARLEGHMGEGPWFLGERFSLVDATFAPLLQRIAYLNASGDLYTPGRFPRLEAWAKRLEATPEVQGSLVPEWRTLMAKWLEGKGSYIQGVHATAA